MMKIKFYKNKRNPHKFIEVHNDGHYHNTVRQFIAHRWCDGKNYTGDGALHRWRIGNLKELLEDYTEVSL